MWQTFLKEAQKDIIIPPGFKQLTVVGKTKGVYKISLKRRQRFWSVVDGEGKIHRKARYNEIISALKLYPKLHGCLLQVGDHTVMLTADTICRVNVFPSTEVQPKLLTPIVCRKMGTVIIFDDFDYRDTQPWNIENALSLLLMDTLPDKAPSYLTIAQKTAFNMLLEHEKENRVPKTEQKIRSILDTENANLLSIQETNDGYALTFNFRGRKRNIRIKEDLMLLSSGMCLEGGDRNYSLDTFLSILEHEDSGRYGHPIYYNS